MLTYGEEEEKAFEDTEGEVQEGGVEEGEGNKEKGLVIAREENQGSIAAKNGTGRRSHSGRAQNKGWTCQYNQKKGACFEHVENKERGACKWCCEICSEKQLKRKKAELNTKMKAKSKAKRNDILSEAKESQISPTGDNLWHQTSWLLIVTAMVGLASMKEHWGTDILTHLKVGLAVIAFVGSLVLHFYSSKETKAALGDTSSSNDNDDANKAQAMGALTVCIMAFCMGALVLNGTTEFVMAIAKPLTFVERALEFLGISTSFVTAGLLWTLRYSFL